MHYLLADKIQLLKMPLANCIVVLSKISAAILSAHLSLTVSTRFTTAWSARA